MATPVHILQPAELSTTRTSSSSRCSCSDTGSCRAIHHATSAHTKDLDNLFMRFIVVFLGVGVRNYFWLLMMVILSSQLAFLCPK